MGYTRYQERRFCSIYRFCDYKAMRVAPPEQTALSSGIKPCCEIIEIFFQVIFQDIFCRRP